MEFEWDLIGGRRNLEHVRTQQRENSDRETDASLIEEINQLIETGMPPNVPHHFQGKEDINKNLYIDREQNHEQNSYARGITE